MTRATSRLRVRFAACALLFAMLCAQASAVTLRAWFDRDTMQLGETATLNIEADAANTGQPEFSTLKQDFDLHGTQSSQQISIVNGSSAAKTLWAIALEPRHAGRISVAPITVGNVQTNPLQLNVLAAASAATAKADADVFLDIGVDPLTPYVQQEVRYTLKLYYALDLGGGDLSEPKADGLGVKRLGQDKSYAASVGARHYRVLERHYALTPERSGTIDIPAIVFRGTALNATDPMNFFRAGRNVSAHSDPVQLVVKPKPAAWTTLPWLPSAAVLLTDESALPAEVRVGDPITRTIRLQAKGLGHEQLPELSLTKPDGAEIYPDKPDTRTRDDGEWLYGERVQKFAFVASRAGTLTIPAVEVHWWDTQNDRAEIAQMPAKTITVLAAPGAVAAIPGAGVGATPETGSAPSSAPPSAASPTLTQTTPPRLRIWKTLALVGFALWLTTLALWWRARRDETLAKIAPKSALDTSSQRAAFLRACSLGEFAAAERALVAWARSERSAVRNLGELAKGLGDPIQQGALADLQRTRYAGVPAQGLASRLRHAFQGGLGWCDEPARRVAVAALPALYPERD